MEKRAAWINALSATFDQVDGLQINEDEAWSSADLQLVHKGRVGADHQH